MVKAVENFAALMDDYDLFILDQWGVLHNGVVLLGDALALLQAMRTKGKKTAILSNSGKPAKEAIKRMEKLGIGEGLYDLMLTSGEHVRQNLVKRNEPFYQNLGRDYYIFAWNEQEHEVIYGLDYQRVQDIEKADFLICAGLDSLNLDDYESRLHVALAYNIPMICVNSDKVTVSPTGDIVICPGALAEKYEKMGGTVRWHGKPDRWLYHYIEERLGALDHALAVGDSLSHDVKGANLANIDSLLITNGIHVQELNNAPTGESVAALATQYQAFPTYFLPDFT